MNTLGYFILSATVLALPSTAVAVTPGYGIYGKVVSDAQLSQMRGRFVDGNKILFFGVKMRTDWLLYDGTLHEMEMQFNIDFDSNQFRPTLTLLTKAAVEAKAEAASETVERIENTGTPGTVVNESLENISGVVQNIQVAGDGNSVLNDVIWEVTDQEIDTESDSFEKVETTSNSVETTHEVTTEVQVQSNQVGYTINAPGQGRVSQQISSDSVRGLVQNAQLTGDINRVLNQMHLQIQVDPSTHSQRLNNLRSTLSNLRGLN